MYEQIYYRTSRHQYRNTWTGRRLHSLPREFNYQAPVIPIQSVWALWGKQQNEPSRTAFPRIFHSLQLREFHWKLQDQNLCESQAKSKAGGTTRSVMAAFVRRWLTARLVVRVYLSLIYNLLFELSSIQASLLWIRFKQENHTMDLRGYKSPMFD